jgi:hypothetical protein
MTRRRPTVPRALRQVAPAAGLTLRALATAIVDGQPPPGRPRDQAALLRWLGQSVRSEHPGMPLDELAPIMAGRLREMADDGDATAKALLDAEAGEVVLTLAQIEIALAGARWAPHPPELPKQQRMDAIAATVLKLTGCRSVPDKTVEVVYRWLFGDEALFVAGMEMRLEAGLRILENRGLRETRVPHPETGELVLVTRKEIREHGEADHRVLEAAQRHREQQMRWQGA